MPTSSTDKATLELPSHLQIIHDQLKTMDQHVLDLHALLDLLDRPDDQRESLSEMISNLLKNLSDRQAQYQVELAKLTVQIANMETQIKKTAQITHESQQYQHEKLDCILSILGQPH